MRIVVLGAGVIGVASAYKLCKAGHEVVLIDQLPQSGMATSFANGGQLSFKYHHTIANLNVLKQMPKILLGLEPAFSVSPTLDLDFYSWAGSFLTACLPSNVRKSEEGMTFLGELSKQQLDRAVDDTKVEFDYQNNSGKLYLHTNNKGFDKATFSVQHTSYEEVILAKDLSAMKLGLNKDINYSGGIFVKEDASGDAHKFCVNMTQYLVDKYKLKTQFGDVIKNIDHDQDSIKSVVTDKGTVHADAYVLALGCDAVKFAKSINIKLPIYPMKGYSVTLPAKPECPDISITFLDERSVFCKLGDRVRIAGFAEFSGYEPKIKKEKIKQLISFGKTFLPEAADYDTVLDEWCGVRPVTPDSLPIIGQSKYSNLYLNVGHGMLGWTHAMGSSHILERIISRQNIDLTYKNYYPQRFST